MEKIKRMEKLVDELNVHVRNYYVLDAPTISDSEYDKLYDELVMLEKETGIILPSSPTQRVGGEILEGFKKFVHDVPLYSLDKSQTYEGIVSWVNGIKQEFPNSTFSVEYKFDGLSIVVEYENGMFKRAGTRGNGKVGEDVTEQAKTIKSVPLEIPFKRKLVVQGEGMITLSNLEKYNKIATEPLKNARNAVAGAIRNLNPKETAKRNLDLFAYSINYIEGKKFKTQEEENKFLIENGFKTSNFLKICSTAEEIIEEIKKVGEIKNSLDILMDGIVVKLNEVAPREEIGYTSKFPKWAIAYKYEAEEISTILNDVVWQVGRTGKLTPIAQVEPIVLAGAKVSRATLNNMGDIQRKNVKIGSRVFVRRSNEVIPEILGLAEDLPSSKEILPPTKCPCCGGELSEIGANLFCTNVDCQEQIIDSITHFCGKEAMDIDGLSEKTVEQLYTQLGLRKISDIYDLTYEQLLKLDKFKDKKAKNLIESIEKSKTVSISSFIFALGIKNVGLKTAKDLVKNFKTFENIKSASFEDLVNVRDVGEIVAESIFGYFKNEKNLREIENLFNKGITLQKERIEENEFLSGKNVVLTGTLENFSRLEATKILENKGAIVLSSVGKSTNLIIAGENAGSKLEKANKLGIKVINEQEFLKIIEK
ncbi:MAG: NAD-dependent DNA ligase LigA [Eubacteriales bacterium]|nr:NAD-dependent DNA ligase LigA [Eubacteriales bacterium]